MLSRYCFIPVILRRYAGQAPSGPASQPLHESACAGSTRSARKSVRADAWARARPVRVHDFGFWYGLDLRSLHRLPGPEPRQAPDARVCPATGSLSVDESEGLRAAYDHGDRRGDLALGQFAWESM